MSYGSLRVCLSFRKYRGNNSDFLQHLARAWAQARALQPICHWLRLELQCEFSMVIIMLSCWYFIDRVDEVVKRNIEEEAQPRIVANKRPKTVPCTQCSGLFVDDRGLENHVRWADYRCRDNMLNSSVLLLLCCLVFMLGCQCFLAVTLVQIHGILKTHSWHYFVISSFPRFSQIIHQYIKWVEFFVLYGSVTFCSRGLYNRTHFETLLSPESYVFVPSIWCMSMTCYNAVNYALISAHTI